MNVLLGFEVGEHHYARQIDLERNPVALAALGRRCVQYLRDTTEEPFDETAAPKVLLRMLQPLCVPTGRGFVLGIFRRHGGESGEPPLPVGVLCFLPPDQAPGTWSILLLLLEPTARRQGLGSAVHAAFARWAASRGARRLLVAVSEANGQALHFWRDRMGYTETAASRPSPAAAMYRRSRQMEHRLDPAPVDTPWTRLRV